MTRYLNLWRMNPLAPLPSDLAEQSKRVEGMWAALEGFMKKGEIKEFGFFPGGTSGYIISEGTGADVLRRAMMFYPSIESETHEIIPYEKGKEIIRAVLKMQMEVMKK